MVAGVLLPSMINETTAGWNVLQTSSAQLKAGIAAGASAKCKTIPNGLLDGPAVQIFWEPVPSLPNARVSYRVVSMSLDGNNRKDLATDLTLTHFDISEGVLRNVIDGLSKGALPFKVQVETTHIFEVDGEPKWISPEKDVQFVRLEPTVITILLTGLVVVTGVQCGSAP